MQKIACWCALCCCVFYRSYDTHIIGILFEPNPHLLHGRFGLFLADLGVLCLSQTAHIEWTAE